MLTRLAVADMRSLMLAQGAAAQQWIEGKVLSTELTHCDFKPGGCARHLMLETTQAGKGAIANCW